MLTPSDYDYSRVEVLTTLVEVNVDILISCLLICELNIMDSKGKLILKYFVNLCLSIQM